MVSFCEDSKNDFQSLAIVPKSSALDVWQGSEYASVQ